MKQEELHVLACLGWTALWMAAGWLLWLMDWFYQTTYERRIEYGLE